MSPNLDIVDVFERSVGKQGAFERASKFMVFYLGLMESPLPPIACRALEVARKFIDGDAALTELEAAQLDCWKFLQKNHPYDDLGTPEVFAVKAAMRLLYPDPDNSDIIDIVGYFLKMANGFEDHSEEVEPLLREYFSLNKI